MLFDVIDYGFCACHNKKLSFDSYNMRLYIIVS